MSKIAIATFVFCFMLCLGLAHAGSPKPVTLDTAAVESLKDKNSSHYLKVKEVFRVASTKGCGAAVKMLKAEFSVTNAECVSTLLLTSLPSKQRLTFTLEGQAYIMFIE